MDPLLVNALDSIATNGPVAMLLLLAVWWQTRGNQALVVQLNEERTQRLSKMDEEISRQRSRNDECERDRLELHKLIFQLQGEHPAPCSK